jgi:hypothetical protein
MKSVRKVLATACAAAGAAAIVAGTATTAGASTEQGRGHVDYETINGFLAGQGALANAPVIPLRLQGAVNTRGSINLGGNGTVSPIWTGKGTLTVKHGNPNPPPRLNYRTCRLTDTVSTWYTVLGDRSTGAFWGARGNGHAVVVFSAIAPRYKHGPKKGQCNFGNNVQPEPYGAWISFHAQGPLYVKHH